MSRIKVVLADITTLQMHAIVNAANSTLLGGGGVDGAIHKRAGKELWNECYTLNGCKVGEAKLTKGYDLPAKYVIHTVGPIYGENPQKQVELLTNCYKNSLSIARENRLETIAFPSISTGVYGYPIKEAVLIAVNTVREFLLENDYPAEVTFCCFSQKDYLTYQELLNI